MRTVSTEFQRVINKGGPFYAYARINLVSGSTIYLDSQHDFYVSGNVDGALNVAVVILNASISFKYALA